jgi:hypothetical protein
MSDPLHDGKTVVHEEDEAEVPATVPKSSFKNKIASMFGANEEA